MSGIFKELKRRNVIRVVLAYVAGSWLIIQVVETVFPVFSLSDQLIRWAIIALAIGFVPVMVLAWVFEWTPHGIVRDSEVRSEDRATPHAGRRLDRVILVLLALALGYFSIDKFILAPEREKVAVQAAVKKVGNDNIAATIDHASIAVLPFVNTSDDTSNEYFADGIAEEVLNLLARIEEMKVISRSSAFSYKGRNVDIPTVGRELGVAHVIEGSVRKAGSQVRIAVQLVAASSDEQIWAESYDRQLDDIFAIQEDIARRVVEALRLELLTPAPTVTETDPETYALYLKARSLRRQTDKESLLQAERLLREVVDVDPDYLPALDDLITVYTNGAYSQVWPYAEGFELARELTQSSLARFPDFARFWVHMGWVQAFFDGDYAAAAASYDRALRLDDRNLTSLGDTASFLFYIGRFEAALQLHEFLLAADPLHPVGYGNGALLLMAADRAEEAIPLLQRLLILSPDYPNAHYHLARALLLTDRPAEALIPADKEADPAYRLTALAMAQHSTGQSEESVSSIEQLAALHGDRFPYQVATAMAWTGDVDGAFEWLERAQQSGDYMLGDAHIDPALNGLHADPRWVPLLESMGVSQAQLERITFEYVPR